MRATASGAHKPIDLGNGLVCASFGTDASWLSLGTPHQGHGFVELNALPPFDEAGRGNPDATRRFRALMVLDRHAVLRVEVDGAPLPGLSMDVTDPLRPSWAGKVAGLRLAVEARAGAGAMHQRWRLALEGGERAQVVLHLRGRLDRPALAEITELDLPLPTGGRTLLQASGPMARLRTLELPAIATIRVSGLHASWEGVADGETQMRLAWPDGVSEIAFEITGSIVAAGGPAAIPEASADPSIWSPGATGADSVDAEPAGRLTRRAFAYVRGCTALSTGPDERAILTDHRILPLSWTRDAYWQALLLLSSDARGDRERVADHLRWLWRRCERPDGRWARSHHANGRRKDAAFQADQQLYPIVELADHWRATGALPGGVNWTDAVGGAWSAALAEVDPRTGLMASDENAADDPAPARFIAASQILLWYCAARLAEVADAGGVAIDPNELRRIGDQVHSAFDAHLGGTGGGWAYATDGGGMRVAYHDANDLPVALAPLWGFCGPDDPGWRATMRFAFSSANPGFVDGDRPGLGSAHTPGPWTLGDLQAWIAARVIGDDGAADAALTRLDEVAFLDGMLPEAYAATGAAERIRHWFAWPGAALAALRVLDRDGHLETRLSARPVR